MEFIDGKIFVNQVTPEGIEVCRQLNVERIFIGIEATDWDILSRIKKPYTVEVCTQGSSKSGIESFIEGAIVGGAIGNNVPGEKNGGALGAFLGGVYNTERNKGPKCNVETRYEEEQKTIYSHSTVTFTHEGRQYTLQFNK